MTHKPAIGAFLHRLFLLLLICVGPFAHAQNITKTVAPGDKVDIKNTTGSSWYITASANTGGATLARLEPNLISEYTWGSGNFNNNVEYSGNNRVWSGEYLRVYANTLPAGTVITIPYNTPNPASNSYTIKVTVKSAPHVTAITPIDPNPTVASSVRWAVTFSEAVSGVTTANFALTNPMGISGATITKVSGSGTDWIVTATTGTGLGLLGCNWDKSVSESPSIPNGFTGYQYSFQEAPVITSDLVDAYVPTGATYTLSIGASLRSGGAVKYQWYTGSYDSRSIIYGATGSSYTVPSSLSVTSRKYSCRVTSAANSSYSTDSSVATINTINKVAIGTQPVGTTIAAGQTATLSVAATGTAPLHYQWYRGNVGDTSAPQSSASATFTTPALSANTTYWVKVGNNLPANYDVSSTTAAIRVVTSLTGNGPFSTTVGSAFATAPAFTARDSENKVVASVPVTFAAPASGAFGRWAGSSSASVATNSNGLAQSSAFTAGTGAGTYNVTGSYGGVTGSVALTNQPGPASKIEVATAPGSTTTAGVPFSPAPVVRILDAYNNLCTGNNTTVVTATRAAGTGTLQGTTSVTASGGIATFANLIHTVATTITVQFSAGAMNTTSANILVAPAAPSTIVALGGSGQVARPGTGFASSLQTKVADAFGNPMPGRTVTFTAPASGASATLTAATVTTDSFGVASVTATANALSGAYEITANVSPALATPAAFGLANRTKLEAWRNTHFGSYDNTGNGADNASPFGDGVPNLLKYALNLDPSAADTTSMTASGTKGLPLVGVDATKHLTLTFVRRPASTSPGITYPVVVGTDLQTWTANAAATESTTAIDAEFERVVVTDSVATSETGRRFVRLQVTTP